MDPKQIYLSLYTALCFTKVFGYDIAICGGSSKVESFSVIEMESIARDESENLTDHLILDDHDLFEQWNNLSNKNSDKKISKNLMVDYLVRIKLKQKGHRYNFQCSLYESKSNTICAETMISFDENPPQFRRMIRICLRELYYYFYEIENPIVPSALGIQN